MPRAIKTLSGLLLGGLLAGCVPGLLSTREAAAPPPAPAVTAAPAPAPAPAPTPSPQDPDVEERPYEQRLDGIEPAGQRLLEAISRVRTGRKAKTAVMAFATWVLRREERMDLANHGLIKEALRRNQHIRPADVEHYFFSVLDVYPADCSPKGHSRVDRRVSDMQLVAQAADQEELAKALEARREFLRGTRARLDAYQICLDDGPGRRRRWDPWARRRGR